MARRLQCFFAAVVLAAGAGTAASASSPGETHALSFQDVDGNYLSTSDGHVTIVAVVTRRTEEKAREISERVPEHCIGNPKYRYVTLVNFQRGVAHPFRGATRAVIRSRLNSEAKRLQRRYAAKKITREARRDLYVVADFDGSAVERLGLAPESHDVAVFIFDGAGTLVQRWIDVPPRDVLAKAVAAAKG